MTQLLCFFLISVVLAYEDRLSELNEKWTHVAPKAFLLYNEDEKISDKIRKFYFGSAAAADSNAKKGSDKTSQVKGNKIGMGDLESLTNLYSDRYFFGCVKDAAMLHAQYAPVHLYYFTYKQDVSYGYILENTPGRIPVDIELILGYAKLMLYRHVLNWELIDYGKGEIL